MWHANVIARILLPLVFIWSSTDGVDGNWAKCKAGVLTIGPPQQWLFGPP